MRTYCVAVDGGELTVLRFGDGPNVVIAAHGITGSGMSFGAVARELPDGWTLLAPDLRGRGHSNHLPGPWGLARHARDVIAVAEHAGAGPVVLAGHSMGAFVALLAAAGRPELFRRLVLVDGGLPLTLPDGVDPDQALAATLGPALARLTQVFACEQAYLDFFAQHPALGPHWNGDIAAYVRYDLMGEPGQLRSRAMVDAVRQDGRDLLGESTALKNALRQLAAANLPSLLLTAPDGMFGQPPGLLPDELVRQWCGRPSALAHELVPASNHYTILFAAEAAKLLSARLSDPSSWPTISQW